MVEQTRSRMTAAEFFELPETNLPMALIDGEMIMSPAPAPKHQSIVFQGGQTIDRLKPNGTVFLSPIDVALDEENVVQPDIVWVAENSR
ncbi:MAG: restriction endonuclease, partial [Phototrophicales bacterium]